jgi:hypothetical protein
MWRKPVSTMNKINSASTGEKREIVHWQYPLRLPSGGFGSFPLDYTPKSKQAFLCQTQEGSHFKSRCTWCLFLCLCSLANTTEIFQIRKSSHFIPPSATLLGCNYVDQNGNSLISFKSKFNSGLGPKSGLILATSPVHFYVEIKGAFGSTNWRCIPNSHHIKQTNQRGWCWILALTSHLPCSHIYQLP